MRFRDDRPLVIGHRGAPAVAPENTIASFEAAVAAGADAVEFDVCEGLVVAHSLAEASAEPLRLAEALDFFAATSVLVHVDLKVPGVEAGVVEAIRRRGLVGRAYVSSVSTRALRRVDALEPGVGLAAGYPNDRFRVSRFSWPGALTRRAAAVARTAMPLRLPLLLRGSGAEMVSLHWTLVSARVARRVPVLAWTVDDPHEVRRLARLGVVGIATDDPQRALEALATMEPL